ncbi:hypothetical protein FRC14_000219 [Serendipita sp. 396]|nr:hypothetical protein FRC14_000219 [Serendipita sp. 396]KAG8863879.1 hypothetical protein FRC20_010513 [Serendipita sp. 405]
MDCFLQIIRKEGPLALYKGVTPPAVAWAAVDSVLLGSLHNYRLRIKDSSLFTEPVPRRESSERRLTLLGHGVAGLAAGLTSAFLATPVELLKVKLQVQYQARKSDRQFSGPIDCMKQVIRAQGIRGLWRGFAGSLAFRANFFWLFISIEALMRGSARLEGTRFEMSEGTANFLSGGLGSFAFWIMAIPADNVKNRVFAAPLASNTTVREVVRDIYSTAGITGFFRGLAPSMLRAFPVNASAYFVYEGLLRTLGAEKTRT